LIDQLSDTYPTYPIFSDSSRFSHKTTPEKSIATLKSALLKTKGTICLIGVPQVGKSTIIHHLKGTSARLRPTTTLKSHELTPQITLIDTPALLFSPDPLLPLLGFGKATYGTISDFMFLLNELPKVYYTQLERLYGMPALVRPIEGNRFIDPAKDLLVHVARKFGRLGKNGPNLDSAAEIVCGDCLKGKIQWWVEPLKES
jgi:ribosome biogenesis GTPase A